MNAEQRLYARPVRRLFAFVLALLAASQIGLSLFAWSMAEQKLLPESGRKAQAAAQSLSLRLERALGYDIALQKLEGVPDFFDDVLKQNRDLAYLRLSDARGAILFERAQEGGAGAGAGALDTAVGLRQHGALVGHLHVGVDRRHIAARVRELRYDIGIVMLASGLIAFETLWFVVTLNFSAPMRQLIGLLTRVAGGDFRRRAGAAGAPGPAASLDALSVRVNQRFAELLRKARAAPAAGADAALRRLRAAYRFADGAPAVLAQQRVVLVRALCFLFMFAEMLSRPFLPLYAAGLGEFGAAPPDGLRASLPVTAFLLAVALSMPLAGRWSDRVGRRRAYLLGALLMASALAATALLPSYPALVAARAVCGAGYALMFMSCQGYVFDHSDGANRANGMALFVGAIMVAEICAPAIGGILADRIGYRMVFLLGAGVAALAALIAATVLDDAGARAPATAGAQPAGKAGRFGLLGNRRFLALSFLSGIPAKFLYSGFLIFLVPLLLAELGHSKSEVGRYTMLYGLLSLACAPLFARLADRHRAHFALVAGGGALTGLGLLAALGGASADLVLLGIGALGLGQSMSIAAQLALVARVAEAEARELGLGLGLGPVLGLFRLLERLGAAAGPLVAGALAAGHGAPRAMALLGGFGLASSILFALVFAAGRPRSAGPGAERAAP